MSIWLREGTSPEKGGASRSKSGVFGSLVRGKPMMFVEGLESSVTKMLLKKLSKSVRWPCARRPIVCEIQRAVNGFWCSWFRRHDKGERGSDSRITNAFEWEQSSSQNLVAIHFLCRVLGGLQSSSPIKVSSKRLRTA
jgi:hypothetical protein